MRDRRMIVQYDTHPEKFRKSLSIPRTTPSGRLPDHSVDDQPNAIRCRSNNPFTSFSTSANWPASRP